MEEVLLEMTSVNQLSFIPEYRTYIGLRTLQTNPVFIKRQTPIIRLHIWQ